MAEENKQHPGHESPTANWIVGRDAHETQSYIIHTAAPRFIAKLAADNLEGTLSVLSCALSDGRTVYDFVWLDQPPAQMSDLRRIVDGVEKALESARSHH